MKKWRHHLKKHKNAEWFYLQSKQNLMDLYHTNNFFGAFVITWNKIPLNSAQGHCNTCIIGALGAENAPWFIFYYWNYTLNSPQYLGYVSAKPYRNGYHGNHCFLSLSCNTECLQQIKVCPTLIHERVFIPHAHEILQNCYKITKVGEIYCFGCYGDYRKTKTIFLHFFKHRNIQHSNTFYLVLLTKKSYDQ